MDFQKWPSIPRLSKERMTITEKIDGTNSCIRIRSEGSYEDISQSLGVLDGHAVWAQSRSRFLKATKAEDNFGFAKWVDENAQELIDILGPGDHFGEWWGSGIQRGYGLEKGEKRFSLFNAPRWMETIKVQPGSTAVHALCTVPLLYSGEFEGGVISRLKQTLRLKGSEAVEHAFSAEGMVVYLREVNASYKVLLENDDLHKWAQVSE
jgi:hypothetical protein